MLTYIYFNVIMINSTISLNPISILRVIFGSSAVNVLMMSVGGIQTKILTPNLDQFGANIGVVGAGPSPLVSTN